MTFSACVAAISYAGKISPDFILPLMGVFLLAGGASALNQYQERKLDAIMIRTKYRPLPSLQLLPVTALVISLLFICSGLIILAITSSMTCVLLGSFNILWYNGFYTYLKRKTAFAVIPGALTGAIPVLIGWTLAGGMITDPFGLMLAFLIFMWQMPHFWFLVMIHEEDYRNARYPVLSDIFSHNRLKRIIMAWLIGASGASFILVFFDEWISIFFPYAIIILNLLIMILTFQQLFISSKTRFKTLFHSVNLLLLLILLLIAVNKSL